MTEQETPVAKVRARGQIVRTIAIILGSFGLLALAWVIALKWWRDLDVARLGQVGDTVAPIVGILSLLAVLAASRSVRLQSDAVELQRLALNEQRVALRDEMELQREAVRLQGEALADQRSALKEDLELQRRANKLQADALEDQRRALEIQLNKQRHASLGAAYARLFGTLDVYTHEVRAYAQWLESNNADRRVRAERQSTANEKYEQVRLARWQVQFVDADKERSDLVGELALQFALEPRGPDTSTSQKAHAGALLERLKQGNRTRHALREHLLRELGFLDDPDDEHGEMPEKTE